MVYQDRIGKRIRESTKTNDWREAQRRLRERLQARDDKILDVVRKGEQLQFGDWVEFFLENYSKPPIRAEKTHEANQRAALHLKSAFERHSIGDFRLECSSRLPRVRCKRIDLSRQRCTKNCGFFDVC